MKLTKPQIFPTTKSFWIVMAMFAAILIARVFYFYIEYQEFITKPFYFTYGNVISLEQKSDATYPHTLLKIHSDDGLEFYIKSYTKIAEGAKRLRVQIFPDEKISFLKYISTFFVKGKVKEIVQTEQTFRDKIISDIRSQHADNGIKSLYPAMFFNTPVDKELRDKVIVLGISHLIALSGFNLSILWGVIYYGFFWLFYRPLQQRYFPYRYALFDLGLVSIIFLGIYVYMTDFSPSLIRAYLMVVIGWGILLAGMELVSFSFLAIVGALLLIVFPSLVLSLSFWFSIAGVFYIFLILHYSKEVNKHIIAWLLIPLGVFVLMQPIVHGFFGATSAYQLLSIPLEFVYIVFYPTTMVLHVIGYGGIFDNALSMLFAFPPQETTENLLPWWALSGYAALSLSAIKYKYLFWTLCAVTLGYSIYLFAFI
ncbi:MAG: ComEC/Rec2 family competence protein [Sulfurovaceae bacterium]|nr:ComEC/Rec2 family competence protein [Sulfurovaceae bacterium]